MDKKRIDILADEYQDRYNTVLRRVWPTMGGNGFNEHNQTVNYLLAYEIIAKENNEQITTWYEFQIPNENDKKKRNNRIDGMIINHTKKEILLVEAKRFCYNDVEKKRRDVGEDVIRIEELDMSTRMEGVFYSESDNKSDYSVYGVVLFDLWTENEIEKAACSRWKRICDKVQTEDVISFLRIRDDEVNEVKGLRECVGATQREVTCKRWENEAYSYFLNTLVWKKQ